MGHLVTIFFAMIFSFSHRNAEHHPDAFVPPTEFVNTSFKIPVSKRNSIARHTGLNSYSEDACLSCRSMNVTSQPQLVLRAQR